jgi:hypothetical protein
MGISLGISKALASIRIGTWDRFKQGSSSLWDFNQLLRCMIFALNPTVTSTVEHDPNKISTFHSHCQSQDPEPPSLPDQ